jgi:hypothetical protein
MRKWQWKCSELCVILQLAADYMCKRISKFIYSLFFYFLSYNTYLYDNKDIIYKCVYHVYETNAHTLLLNRRRCRIITVEMYNTANGRHKDRHRQS